MVASGRQRTCPLADGGTLLLRLLPFNDEDSTETESLIHEFDWIGALNSDSLFVCLFWTHSKKN